MEYRIYKFDSAVDFITFRLNKYGVRSGKRTELAQYLGTPSSHISQALRGSSHFTLEQYRGIASFLELSEEEVHYFMLLASKERAGTHSLKDYYSKQINVLKKTHSTVESQVKPGPQPSESLKTEYYSTWIHLAVHLCTLVPRLRTPEAISKYLAVPIVRVHTSIKFLSEAGFIYITNEGWQTHGVDLFLGDNAPQITSHHLAWRAKANDSIYIRRDGEIHYAAAFCMDSETARDIYERTLKYIKENVDQVRVAKDEDLYVLSLDFFGLGR